MSHAYDEDALETATLEVLASLGWSTADGYEEGVHPTQVSGRDNLGEVILTSRLLPALEALNPDVPAEGLQQAVDALVADRSVMSLVKANEDVYSLVRDSVSVTVPDDQGGDTTVRVRFVDFDNPWANDFYAVQQFWVTGPMHKRRADVVLFVNGVPLVLMELKASHKNVKNGFTENVTDYKATVPQLFWPNGFIVISNGSDARVGSMSADWEHFAEWKKINSEGEKGLISLDTTLRATCEPERLLDLVENFTVFQEVRGGMVKIVAKNHQYLGVNNTIGALHQIEDRAGRLGVFWHTQGSGKSVSMVFFAQKVLRKVPGNWTFVVVTDRTDLDDQIYKVFSDSGAVTEGHVQADSGDHLRRLLSENHRYVFTLIQKFHTERGEAYPMVSDRSDIIVITDEAHRSQYDTFALNMRNALPNASFLGFTGTPLMAGEERTKEVFGDYVSIYDFKASIDDGATVPLYYENRIPELQLTNEDFNEDMERILEDAELDDSQERKLAREFGREYHLITRADRLDRIARDVVDHFMGRGFDGKAMVVSIDKATAVGMFDLVKGHWNRRIDNLKASLDTLPEDEAVLIRDEVAYMESTDMAVVVSQAQNEIADMAEKGLDIKPHRQRMNNEELDEKFKDPDDPLRIVFVCAMWMTGFDVPSCSTIYLDKPMKNHTLMQAIARANRVWGEKNNGLIVDYIGVFRDLQRALAIYGSGGTTDPGPGPVVDKGELVAALAVAVEDAKDFCMSAGFSLDGMIGIDTFEFIKLRDDAIDLILVTPDTKARFVHIASYVDRLFKAILPDPAANDFGPYRAVLVNLVEKLRSLTPPADISEVMGDVEALLDESVAAKAYVIRAAEDNAGSRQVDLSGIDFDKLAEEFVKTTRKRTEAEKLKALLQRKTVAMIRVNPTRIDYLERLRALIKEYNAGSINVETFFELLRDFAKDLSEEDQRAVAEQLDEEELAILDLLTKPVPDLTAKQRVQVKTVAEELLARLKQEKLTLDWRKKQQTKAGVRVTIEEELDKLPDIYTKDLWREKVERVYQHIYDSYWGEGRSVYLLSAA